MISNQPTIIQRLSASVGFILTKLKHMLKVLQFFRSLQSQSKDEVQSAGAAEYTDCISAEE